MADEEARYSLVVADGDPGARQKLVDVAGRVILHASEDGGEILEGVDAARLARRHQRVQACDACSALDVVDE